MDNREVMILLTIVAIILLSIVCIGACLYAVSICVIRHFHTPLHFLSLNVCIASFIVSGYWTIFYVMNTFYPSILWTTRSCLPIFYLQTTVNCGILYALCMVSLNRLFVVLYSNKRLFRSKKWCGICVCIHWIFAILISLPVLASNSTSCLISGIELQYRTYNLIIVAVIPMISIAVSNSIIFLYARRSSRRVQPMNVENVPVPVLHHRDVRLLKHMIFLFVISFFGWVPSYLIAVITWNVNIAQVLGFQGLRMLAPVSLVINIIDLFWYNHELRRYLTNKPNNRTLTIIKN